MIFYLADDRRQNYAMGRGGKKSNKKKKTQTATNKNEINSSDGVIDGKNGSDWLYVDPEEIRFQHSRIRPYFSGCGKRVLDTLDDIRNGTLRADNLPPIQVIVSREGGETCYFSLNNRRLWVLKECRKEGLLDKVKVRVRLPKSEAERQRYCIKNCSLDAKFIKEKQPPSKEGCSTTDVRETCRNSSVTNKDSKPISYCKNGLPSDPTTEGTTTSNDSIVVIDEEIVDRLNNKLHVNDDEEESNLSLLSSSNKDEEANRTKNYGYANAFSGLEYDSDSTNES